MKKKSRARPLTSSTPLAVFIAYAEVPAARDALAWCNHTFARTNGASHVLPMLWRFDQLAQPQWQKQALHDAARAHALVLALTLAAMTDNSSTALENWLAILATRQAGRDVTAWTLFGHEDAWMLSLGCANASAPPTSDLAPRPRRPLALDAFAA